MKISEAQTLAKILAKEFDEKYERKSTVQLYSIDMIKSLGS